MRTPPPMPPPPPARYVRACSRCRFWEPIKREWEESKRGWCRRNAPLVTGGLYGPTETVWPETGENDWCGDGLPRFEGQANGT